MGLQNLRNLRLGRMASCWEGARVSSPTEPEKDVTGALVSALWEGVGSHKPADRGAEPHISGNLWTQVECRVCQRPLSHL